MVNTSEFSPASKNDNYLYTKGGELSLDGNEYIGEYHIDSTTPKTGPVPSKDSKVLRRLYPNKDQYTYDKVFQFNVPITKFVNPKPYLYTPTEQIYEDGFDTRYFVEKVNDDGSYAIEISKAQYDLIGKPKGIDDGIYGSAAIEWKLTGRREDIIKHNQTQLQKAIKTVPTIDYAVRNYLEFARITLV